MALRYLALFETDDLPPTIPSTMLALRRVISRPGFLLYVDKDDETPLVISDSGAIIGHLFQRPPQSARVKEIDDGFAEQIQRTRGKHLIEHYWGGYVCLTQEAEPAHSHIVRDPSGALPCLYMKLPRGWAVSSDIETLVDAGLVSSSIDWDSLKRHLTAYDLRTSNTCLTGIFECLAGTHVSLSKTAATITHARAIHLGVMTVLRTRTQPGR